MLDKCVTLLGKLTTPDKNWTTPQVTHNSRPPTWVIVVQEPLDTQTESDNASRRYMVRYEELFEMLTLIAHQLPL